MSISERLREIAKDKDIEPGWCLSLCQAADHIDRLEALNTKLSHIAHSEIQLRAEVGKQLDEAHKLLKDLEWCGSWNSYTACFFCHGHPNKGHSDTCRLKLFLGAQ